MVLQDHPTHHKPAPTADALLAIIARHKAAFAQRTYDFSLRGKPAELRRGGPEHAAAYGQHRPQWHNHVASVRQGGKRLTYLDAMHREARQAFGPDGPAAIDGLL